MHFCMNTSLHYEFVHSQRYWESISYVYFWASETDIQCFTVQPVLEIPPRLKNKPVPDQIIKLVPFKLVLKNELEVLNMYT